LQQGTPGEQEGNQAERTLGGVWSLLADSLPAGLQGAPATTIVGGLVMLWYLAAVVLTGGDILAFSAYTLRHLGATHGVLIAKGEWWRVVTSNFTHHDLIHLAFNLYALALVGPKAERIFGSSRVFVSYVGMGAIAMSVSHIWYTELSGQPFVTSGGASGAISGLIGLALVGGHRFGTSEGRMLRDEMIRWAIYMALFGFIAGFVNNAAHGGGFVAGLAFGAGLRLSLNRPKRSRWVAAAAAVSVVAMFVLCGMAAAGGSASLPGAPRSILGISLGGDLSALLQSVQATETRRGCTRPSAHDTLGQHEEAIAACESLVRIDPMLFGLWSILGERYEAAGRPEEAAAAKRAAAAVAKADWGH
jgi:membrane associated rhomboid family serine protease